jgi:hypothetical protein
MCEPDEAALLRPSLSRMRPTSSLAQRIEHRQPVYFLPNKKGQSGPHLVRCSL